MKPFRDREDAAMKLAQRFRGLPLRAPVVLAIPRGGIVIGAVLAQSIGAELDVAPAEHDSGKALRAVRPPAHLRGRSVIVCDDGIVTGSTMTAALREARRQRPHELIAAVPVMPAGQIDRLALWCERVMCLLAPENVRALADHYIHFDPVEDDEVAAFLKASVDGRSASAL